MTMLMADNIILEIKNGNKKSFRSLYEMLISPLYSFANKFLNDTLLLEDIVQESFVSYWGKKNDFENIAAVKSFLYSSVRNACLNYLKHQKVEQKHEESIAYQLESEHYFQNSVIEEETFNLLYLEIKNLPESTQQIMLLALNGLKNPEIAEELGISVNTVKTLKKNAYSKLRLKLSPAMQNSLYSFLF